MESSLQAGDVLASKYRVESVLGAGAMGVVVAARHVQLGSRVALKFMAPEALKVPGASSRFIREARAAAALRSEYVARVSDYGTLDTGAPYIVMELLEGCDLDDLRKARGPLPIAEAVSYLLDACKAMDEAHAAGIVHRDLKPKNMFLTHRADGTPIVKVLDFGISKFAHDEEMGGGDTRSGAILGSPAFMSPEQIRSAKHVDARSDIYALGAVLFQLLTNQSPYGAQSFGEIFAAILHSEPRTLRQFRPEAPAGLEEVIARCLNKDPAARFSNVRELAMALQPFLVPAPTATLASAGHDVPATREVSHAQSTFGPAATTSHGRVTARTVSSSALLIGGFAVIGIVVLLLMGGLALRKYRHQADAPPVPETITPVAPAPPTPPPQTTSEVPRREEPPAPTASAPTPAPPPSSESIISRPHRTTTTPKATSSATAPTPSARRRKEDVFKFPD